MQKPHTPKAPKIGTALLVTVIFMDILTGMEFDLFVPSFPALKNHFNLSTFWLEALLSVNFIGYCISLFIVGGLADRHGRKPIILLGLSLFAVGCMLCLMKDSYAVILFGRFLQGIGIAAPATLSFLLIADYYPIEKQQFLMAMLNGSINIAVGIAPIIGSYIAAHLHWRWNFIALLILSLITLAITLRFIPNPSLAKAPTKSLIHGYQSLFQSKPLLILMSSIIVSVVPYWVFAGISPLLYIKSLHVSLPAFGLYQGTLAFAFAIGSIAFGLIIHRYSTKKSLYAGWMIFILALLMFGFVTLTNSTHPMMITFAMLIFVIGEIIPSTILYPLCLNFIPEAKAKISATLQGFQLIFSALSIQIAGYFYHGTFRHTGIIIMIFIILSIITLYAVIQNKSIMDKRSYA